MPNKKIALSKIDTRAPKGWDKEEYKKKTEAIITELDELQNLLFAAAKYSVLVIIQGMDASGKDGLIKDVFGNLNPQGVLVKSFKTPTALESAHDFLWRIHMETPAKGQIKIFNRSHYEDILITRVHQWIDEDTALRRVKAINDFERLLEENGTLVIKYYLHISPEEQQKRLMERLTIPRKMWKYNAQDLEEARRWDVYQEYYEEAMNQCNRIPWHVIPADQNWMKNYYVAKILKDSLSGLDMKYPGLKPEDEQLAKSIIRENRLASKK